ncbi:UNVERIFIED_CONTAM: hypothetical protein K2H54_028196 [Gekko kuhli]
MAPWLLPLVALCLHLSASRGAEGAGCGACQPDRCPPVRCAAPELTAQDECGCCERCLSVEGERCGGTRGARCGQGLVCVSQRAEGQPEADEGDEEGTGRCVCEEDGAVCGSDGRSYGSVCALRLHSWRALHAGRERVRKTHDGECKLAGSPADTHTCNLHWRNSGPSFRKEPQGHPAERRPAVLGNASPATAPSQADGKLLSQRALE